MINGPQPGEQAAQDGSLDSARDAVDALWAVLRIIRRRWLLVFVLTAVSLASAIVVVALVQPIWRASATLVINLTGPKVLDDVKGVGEEDDFSAYAQYFETQKEIIKSRKVASAALDKLGIANDPVFNGVDGINDPAERAKKMEEIDPVDRLREMIIISEVHNSRIVSVSAEYPDPAIARDIANEVAQAYLDYYTGSREETGKSANENLSNEVARAKSALESAEAELDSFKAEHEITTIALEDRQNLITQNITTLSARSKAAQAHRYELEAEFAEANRLFKAGNLASASFIPYQERMEFDEVLSERLKALQEFEAIRVRYEEKHPKYQAADARRANVERQLEQTRKDLLDGMAAKTKAARATESKLNAALGVEQQRALELGRLEPEYRSLERSAKTAGDSYEALARRAAEIGVTTSIEQKSEQKPVEFLDRATRPLDPVRPRKVLVLGASLIIGLVLGSSLAMAADLRDQRIRSVADLGRAIGDSGLALLGQLPLLPPDPNLGMTNVRAQRRHRDLYSHLHPQSRMAERIRGIRTSIAFQQSIDGPTVLLITSPGSAEGKSSTAMNLAMSFCQAGKKTLLVDADMRRPRLHQVFPPPVGREAIGLSGVLEGTVPLAEAVRPSGADDAPQNLDVLSCGAVPTNPAELLAAPRCRQVVSQMKELYDVVVIDTPPVLPVADPLILAPQSDGVVLVARCQSTTRVEIQRAVSSLRQGDTNLVGIVLNEVDARTEGYGYRSEYYTYRSVTESADEPA